MSPHAPAPRTLGDAMAAMHDRLEGLEALIPPLLAALRITLDGLDALRSENQALRKDIDLVTEREREGRGCA